MSETVTTNGRRLYLLDAMALAYRSHFIFINRPLINSKGKNTSATYGFVNALIKLVRDHGMDHIAVVFDAIGEGGTFRDQMYEHYKAHREKMPEDLAANLPYIKEVVQALDIPVLEIPGVEADDVIGSLACKAAAEDAEVVIVSPDKDFQQLISRHISIFRPASRGETFDPITVESFHERFGVEPKQFIDILALMGDASDNVPGVPGIGEKTAMQLIQQYGTVENLLEHAEEVSGKKAREGLIAHRQDALLSKQLVTIKVDCDVQIDWHQFRREKPDLKKLEALFDELEFRSLMDRFREEDPMLSPGQRQDGSRSSNLLTEDEPTAGFDFGPYEEIKELSSEEVDYRTVRNWDDLEALAAELEQQALLCFDTETTSTNPMMASLVGLAFSWKKGVAAYIPTPLPDGTPTEQVLDALRPFFERETLKVGQNIKYDILVLARHGVRVRGPVFDTMIAHYLLAAEEPHGLDALARKYLNYRMIPITSLIGTGKNQISMRDVPVEQVCPYCCEDADIALQLYDVLRQELESTGLIRVAEGIEFPLMDVLVDMELTGVRVDPAMLKDISRQLGSQIQALGQQIYEVAGETFNIGSTQQLCEILFQKLKLRVISKTSTGKPSTKENVLAELAIEHPLPGLILDWRHLSKLKSTYVDSLGDLIHPETGRIHTDYNQTIAATGRLSSTNPNLQNIPIRTEQGREIRRAFVAADGFRLMSADYIQIELRILAAMSGDEALYEAFQNGGDIHVQTAARIFKVPVEEVTRDMRRKAKEVNYGIPYGISAWGIAQRQRIPLKEAQELIDQYQRSYPGVAQYLVRMVEKAREKGYIETMMGRRRYVPNINTSNRTERQFAERISVNMPIQGTQADMIKIAMIRIRDRIKREGLRSRMLLQVHDELVFEVTPEEENHMRLIIREEMVNALPMSVPVEVDVNVGDNWLDAH
jgi:DNA polymerase I